MQSLPAIPGYLLLKPVGGGSMTAVYAARVAATDAACAVKLIRADWDDQETAVKLLQREARAGLTVRHPHVVKINDAHVTRPPYFLVMELLSGESLRSRLQREFRIAVADALWIVRQAAEGLAALHRAGFVHADVKPENIWLADDGNVKLIDLGFAHRPGENNVLLQAGYVLGTPSYLAPEACGPEPVMDFRSDVFSLGVVLFEMLAGRTPFPPGTTEQTLRRHYCDPPARIEDYVARLPKGLAHALDQLLAHRPEARPGAAAVVRQLVALEIAMLGRRRSA